MGAAAGAAGLAGSFAGSFATAGAGAAGFGASFAGSFAGAGLAGSVCANTGRAMANTIADAIQLTREFLMVLASPKKTILIIISYNESQTRS